MTGVDHRCAVLGRPISHSLSPVLHNAAYHALGLDDWLYTRAEVGEDDLAGFLRSLDSTWTGLSLTMPLKRTVIPLGECMDEWSTRLAVANTAILDSSGRNRPRLYNTDVEGIRQAILNAPCGGRDASSSGGRETSGRLRLPSDADPTRIAIIGNGNTALSAVAACSELTDHGRIVVIARHPGRNTAIPDLCDALPSIHAFDAISLDDVPAVLDRLVDSEIVISTLPAHAADSLALSLRDRAPRLDGTLLDVAYDPMPSLLLREWDRHGGTPIGGEHMLVHQAVAQVRLMVGSTADGLARIDSFGMDRIGEVMDRALRNAVLNGRESAMDGRTVVSDDRSDDRGRSS